MKPSLAPTAWAAMTMPSMSRNGSPSMSIRSAYVPESPSSALQQMNFRSPGVSSTVCHLIPVGKPAPPRPRSPEAVTWADEVGRRHRQRSLERDQAAVRAVVARSTAGR